MTAPKDPHGVSCKLVPHETWDRLTDELQALDGLNQKLREEFEKYKSLVHARHAAMEVMFESLRALIQQAEWRSTTTIEGERYPECPWCGDVSQESHSPACPAAKLMNWKVSDE